MSTELEEIARRAANWIFARLPATGGEVDFTRLELQNMLLSACKDAARKDSGFLGRIHDALVVAFIAGCHCGGKSNPNWRSGHAENCSAGYFSKLIEEVEQQQSERLQLNEEA